MKLKKPTIFITTLCLVLLLAFTSVSFAQVPAGGATDVPITATYDVPLGSPGTLVNATSYDLAVLNSAGSVVIGSVTNFTYDATLGNTGLAGPALVNYTDYQWVVVLAGESPTAPASGVQYGPFTFTTIGPTITLTGGAVSIDEDGGTTDLTATASAPIGKDLAVTVTYTGTVDNSVYGTDFTNTGGTNPETITITGGTLTKTTTITGVVDALLEGDETVIATITALASGVIGGSPQTVTITDNYLTAPVHGLTGVPIEPTFSWKGTTSGETYKIQITTTSGDYSSPVVDLLLADGLISYQVKETDAGVPLSNNTTYFWRITDGTNYSNEWQFTTIPVVTITLGNPLAGTVYTTSTMFTWAIDQAVGSLQFKLQILPFVTGTPTATDWDSAPTFSTTTSNLYYTYTLTPGTRYFWRIVLLNGTDVIGYSSVINFTTSGGAAVTVTPSYPTGGVTVYTNPPTLYWYVNQYAPSVTYVIRYSTSSTVDGNGALSSSPDSLAATSNLYAAFSSALASGTTYWWQVSSRYGTTVGTWTTPTSFVTNSSGALITPTLSYPTGGVTVYTIAPTLYWYLSGSSSGLTFDIDYGTSVDGTADVTGVSSLYYALSGLTPGTTYSWRVRSNNGTPGTWSSTETFVVSGGVTSSSTVATWPVGDPTMYTQTPTLNWYLNGSSVGITGYKVKYSTTNPGSSSAWNALDGTLGTPDATDGEVTLTGVSTTFWTSTANLTYGQKYYWAVASWDGSSAGTYSTGSFTIAGGASGGSVLLSSPVGGVTVTTKSPTLYWYYTGSTIGIVGYDVQYSDNGGLSSWTQAASALSSTTPSVALSALTAGATYTWKVRAYYGSSVYSSYSTATTFIVSPSATAIVPIVGGPNNVTINTSVADVSWILPTAPQGNLKYELVFADNKELQNAQKITSNDPYTEVSALQANKSYYWKVRSVDDNGAFSSYSNLGTFKTDEQITEVGGTEITPTEFKLSQNYPNPFNPSTIIKYSLPEALFVTINIYNVLGREIRTLVNGSQNVGNYQTAWNGLDNAGNKVATGMYIYRITAGNYVATKKMLLLK